MIPLLKENIEKECDSEMIILIGDRIVSMVVEQEKHQVCGLWRGRNCCRSNKLVIVGGLETRFPRSL